MTRKITLYLSITTALLALFVVQNASTAQAATVNEVIITKNFNLTSTGDANLRVSGQSTIPTVFKSDQVIQVVISVNNSSARQQTVTLYDTYKDSTGSGFGAIGSTSDAGWYLPNKGPQQAAFNNTCPSDATSVCVTQAIPANTTWEFHYNLTNSQLPNYKERLMALPVSSDANIGSSGNQSNDRLNVYAVGYALFTPVQNSVLSSSFVTSTDADAIEIIPGHPVQIFGGSVTTPSTLSLSPQNSPSTATRTCKEGGTSSTTITGNRSGACLVNPLATLTINNLQIQKYASASLEIVPSSAIVGGLYSAQNVDLKNLLLPGQHIAGSGSTINGSTAQNNINNYTIDKNSVGGFDTTQVYSNVYLNANIQRLISHADTTLSASSSLGNNTLAVTCNSNCSSGSPAAQYLMQIKPAANGTCNGTLDLSSSALTTGGTVPVNPRTSGYVLYVPGSLTIQCGNGTASGILHNVSGGTIAADGAININNVSIDSSLGGTKHPPLGLIAGLSTNAKGNQLNIGWNWNSTTPPTVKTNLESVALLAPKGTFAATTTAGTNTALQILGSIVANTVDLSGVTPVSDPDLLNIQITYDSSLTQTPPPGFSVFALPVVNDNLP